MVPRWLWALLAAALAAQLAWQARRVAPEAHSLAPPAPPSAQALQLASLGEREAAARVLSLYVQSFDLRGDYAVLVAWLTRVLELDPRNAYPLFLAARVYSESPDPARVRRTLEFVHEAFLHAPNQRWPWLAHAALVAKHRLGDLPLARRYAAAVQRHASAAEVPLWAKQMEIFILEDMGELDAARIMLGGLLESGTISDPAELRFLRGRLQALEERSPRAR